MHKHTASLYARVEGVHKPVNSVPRACPCRSGSQGGLEAICSIAASPVLDASQVTMQDSLSVLLAPLLDPGSLHTTVKGSKRADDGSALVDSSG